MSSCSASRSGRGDRVSDMALALPPGQWPRRGNSSSGRAMHSRTSRASAYSATCSSPSSRIGSAHWRSSMTRIRGRRRARASSSRCRAQKVSSGRPVSWPKPRSWAMRSVTSVPRSSPPSSSPRRARAWSAESSGAIPADWRTTSTIGHRVTLSPKAGQWPRSTAAWSPRPATNSSTSRDFPTPAEPSTLTRWQVPSAAARSNRCRSSSCSRTRPTMGAIGRRARPGRSGRTSSSRHTCWGSVVPLIVTGPASSALTASATSR
jgi:hypothetical protein